MESMPLSSLVIVPGGVALAFMVWVFWMFLKASGKH